MPSAAVRNGLPASPARPGTEALVAAPFAVRLHHRVQELDTRVCLGIDPRPALHASTDPEAFDGDPAKTARAIVMYFRRIIDSTHDLVACYKPQVAFFEALGIPGLIALAQLQADIRERGVPLLSDGKRGDLDSTAEAYAATWLADGVFASDALTVNPWMGTDSLLPFTDRALEHGRGVFVVVRTSNPGGADFQELRDASGVSVAEHVARRVAELGEEATLIGAADPAGYAHIGAVIGATLTREQIAHFRWLMPRAIFLLPGYGSQGGTASAAAAAFDSGGLGGLVSASRSLTYFGRDTEDYADRAREATLKMRDDVNQAIRSAH